MSCVDVLSITKTHYKAACPWHGSYSYNWRKGYVIVSLSSTFSFDISLIQYKTATYWSTNQSFVCPMINERNVQILSGDSNRKSCQLLSLPINPKGRLELPLYRITQFKHQPLKFLITSFFAWPGLDELFANGERSWKWFPNEEKFAFFCASAIKRESPSTASILEPVFCFFGGWKFSSVCKGSETRVPFLTLLLNLRFFLFPQFSVALLSPSWPSVS